MKRNNPSTVFFRKASIQTRVFVSYACLVIGMIAVFLIIFNTYVANNAIERANENMSNSVALLKGRLDEIVQNMDRVSLGLSFSEDIRRLLRESPDTPITELFYSVSAARQTLTTSYALSTPIVLQVNVIRSNGHFVGAGNAYFLNQIPEDVFWSTPWIQNALDQGGTAYLTYPRIDEWSRSGKIVFSIARMAVGYYNFSPGDYSNVAVTEVQQDYASVEDAVRAVSNNSYIETRTLIFDGDGALVYPYGDKDGHRDVWALIETEPENNMIETVIDNEAVMLYTTRCDSSDWTIVQTVDRQAFLSAARGYNSAILVAGIFMFVFALLFAYLLSRRLTLPIRQMAEDAYSLNIDTPVEKLNLWKPSKLREVDELQKAYRQMLERLQNSLSETITARSLEMQSRMMALQAQMNPHFLYNSISTIHLMAGQDGNERIAEMCVDLSAMLRYALREYADTVQMRDEAEFAKAFLNIMSKRYLDDLEYEISIPECIMGIEVPKLIVQPLIENCFKYGMGNAPPLKTSIIGSESEGMWRISVSDNGTGFSDDARAGLLAKFRSAPDSEEAPQKTETRHIGLINIIERLRLLYGEKTVFEISANSWGGATVTIGGSLEKR